MPVISDIESSLERLSDKYQVIDGRKTSVYYDKINILKSSLAAFFKHHLSNRRVSDLRTIITDFDGTLTKANLVKHEINLIFDSNDAADYFVHWVDKNNVSYLKAQLIFLELCHEFNWSRKHSQKVVELALNDINEPLFQAFAKMNKKKTRLYIATMNFRSIVDEFNKVLVKLSNNHIHFDGVVATEDNLNSLDSFYVNRLISLSSGSMDFHGKRLVYTTKINAIRQQLSHISYKDTLFITDSGVDISCISKFHTIKLNHEENEDLIRRIANNIGVYDKCLDFGSDEIINYLDSII